MTNDRYWEELRQRAGASAPGAADAADGEGDRDRRLLLERARALARPAAAPAPVGELTLLAFSLGGESWNVQARFVWEALRLTHLTPLPGARPPVAGITTWRGAILPVLDLRTVLGLPARPLADLGYVIVVGEDEPAFGVLADALGSVLRLGPDALREPGEGVAVHREWILGVTPDAAFALDAQRLVQHFA